MGLFDFFKNSKAVPSNAKNNNNTSNNNFSAIPIEKKIKGKNPNCDGFYPHEILVLSYATKYYNTDNEFQRFWLYTYGINDVQKILDSLQKRYVIELGSISDALNLEKTTTIKEQLKLHGLKVTGKKSELIARLIENVPESELDILFNRRPYVLTDLGENLLKKFEWIPYIHSHGVEGLDIWNLTDMVQSYPQHRYRDLIWGHLNKISIEHAQHFDFGLYRNVRLQMFNFLEEENNNPRQAFMLLCEVIRYDLSGLDNNFNIRYIDIKSKFFFPYEDSIIKTSSGYVDTVMKYAELFNWSENEVFNKLVEEFNRFQLPFSVFTSDECANIVMAELHKDTATLKSIYSLAEKRLKKQYKI